MLSLHHSRKGSMTRKPVNYEDGADDTDSIRSYLDLYGSDTDRGTYHQGQAYNQRPPNSSYGQFLQHQSIYQASTNHHGQPCIQVQKRKPFLSGKAAAAGRNIVDMFRGWGMKSNRSGHHARYNSECVMHTPDHQAYHHAMMAHEHNVSRDTSLPTIPYMPSVAMSPRLGNQYNPSPKPVHQRANSARPLPTTPMQMIHNQPPQTPRDPRARRPTGPRDLPIVLKTTLDPKDNEMLIQTLQKETMQEMQKLVTLISAYTSCPDVRLEAQIREKWVEVKGKTEAIETNILKLFPASTAVVATDSATDSAKDLVESANIPSIAAAAEPDMIRSKSACFPVSDEAEDATVVRSDAPSSRSSSGGSEIIKKFATKLGLDVQSPNRNVNGVRRPGSNATESNTKSFQPAYAKSKLAQLR